MAKQRVVETGRVSRAQRALECGDLASLLSVNPPHRFWTADESVAPPRVALERWPIDSKAMRGHIALRKRLARKGRGDACPPLKQRNSRVALRVPCYCFCNYLNLRQSRSRMRGRSRPWCRSRPRRGCRRGCWGWGWGWGRCRRRCWCRCRGWAWSPRGRFTIEESILLGLVVDGHSPIHPCREVLGDQCEAVVVVARVIANDVPVLYGCQGSYYVRKHIVRQPGRAIVSGLARPHSITRNVHVTLGAAGALPLVVPGGEEAAIRGD
jgi:hypothetical protein